MASQSNSEARLIKAFHAHIYFDSYELEDAREFASEAKELFGCGVGKMHSDSVGPHPRGSCQLSFEPDAFGKFAIWATEARGDLTIMAHGLSGDDLADHTDHVIWFGSSEPLDLTIFR